MSAVPVAPDETPGYETFTAGFDFARLLRSSRFRAQLRASGWVSGQHVVTAVDDEPVLDVVSRISFHETGGRALIAVRDEGAEFGFAFMMVEVVREPPTGAQPVPFGPGASIGMLYAALKPCGTYVPNEWMSALLFERVATANGA
jgi:hypothetical protein